MTPAPIWFTPAPRPTKIPVAPPRAEKRRVPLTVDGQAVDVEQGATVLDACRAAIAEQVVSDARSLGFRGFDAEARLGEEVISTRKKDTLTTTGPGEFRYGVDYLWQPMTFACEWDTSKNRFKKGKYKKDKTADIAALPPVKARAVSECKDEIRERVDREANRRGYYRPSITVEPGVTFEELSEGLQMSGRLEYKLRRGAPPGAPRGGRAAGRGAARRGRRAPPPRA